MLLGHSDTEFHFCSHLDRNIGTGLRGKPSQWLREISQTNAFKID